jgi:hypothetical protein
MKKNLTTALATLLAFYGYSQPYTDSNGNVGIGTSVPIRKLVVSNSGNEGLEFGPGYMPGRSLIGSYNRSGSAVNALDFHANAYNFMGGPLTFTEPIIGTSATFNASGSANAGTLNLISSDSFIRLNSTNGTLDKQKWDIRAISASGYEGLEFRTVNNASDVFRSKMFIAHNGSVGIGTVSPSNGLQIANAGDDLQLTLGNATVNRDIAMNMFSGAVNAEVLRFQSGHRLIHGLGSAISKQSFLASGAEILTLTNGGVGIGTITPSNGMQIAKAGDDLQLTLGSATVNRDISMNMFSGAVNAEVLRFQSGHRLIHGVGSAISKQSFLASGAEIMTLTNGNVGIGTITPDSKLAVNGTIHTKEVKVDMNGWSDFVFEPSYKLPDLKETEQFIKENQHLPEIPSAAEVLKDGIKLGEMNAKLLQKIEELTLHLIEQNKLNSQQNKRIEELEKQLKK